MSPQLSKAETWRCCQSMQVAGRAPKGSQHRRQASDASGSPLGNGGAENGPEGCIRFGDEPEDGGRKGSGGGARLRLDIEQQKPERRSNGHYNELSGAAWRVNAAQQIGCLQSRARAAGRSTAVSESYEPLGKQLCPAALRLDGDAACHMPSYDAGSDAGSAFDEDQAEAGASGQRPQVSFLTAVLMAVALTFHSLLEVRSAVGRSSNS